MRQLFTAALFVTLTVPAVALTPIIEPNGHTINVNNVTAGGNVFVFSVAQVRNGYFRLYVPFEATVTDSDNDGAVHLDYPQGVVPKSVWIAADQVTGNESAGAPLDSPSPSISEVPGAPYGSPLSGGGFATITIPGRSFEFALIRPGQPAWRVTVDDGGPGDEDGANNGSITFSAAHMRGLTPSTPPPAAFLPGDVVVAIDPFTLDVLTAKVPQ